MSDLRHQIENLSAAEKAELLDAVWESLEADALLLTDTECADLDSPHRAASAKIPPMSSPGSESGRACSRIREAAGRLDT